MTYTNLGSNLVSASFNFSWIDTNLNGSFLWGNWVLHLTFWVVTLLYGCWFLYCLHSRLHSLALSLHNNLLTYLPPRDPQPYSFGRTEFAREPTGCLRFVRDLTYDPPTLLELAARTIKIQIFPTLPMIFLGIFLRYLSLASNCPNLKCGGKLIVSCYPFI